MAKARAKSKTRRNPTSVEKVADEMYVAMRALAPCPGCTVPFFKLRSYRSLAGVPKNTFDDAALLLQKQRRALLAIHDDVPDLDKEDLDALVYDRANRKYYVSIYDRNPGSSYSSSSYSSSTKSGGDATSVEKVADEMYAAMRALAPCPSCTVPFYKLRSYRSLAGVSKNTFDDAALLLQKQRRALLAIHDDVPDLDKEDLDALVYDRANKKYYVSIYDRNPDSRANPAKRKRNGLPVEEKTKTMVAEITSRYTPEDWANVAIYGADLTADQIVKAEWNAPFVHRDALRDAIMRESGKYITSYDSARAILDEADKHVANPAKRKRNSLPVVAVMGGEKALAPVGTKSGVIGDKLLKAADALGKKIKGVVAGNPRKKRTVAKKATVARKRKRNPETEAEKAYREFHGLEPKEVIEVIEQEHVHKYTWEVGQLVCLDIIRVDGKPQKLVSAGFSEEGSGKNAAWEFDSDNFEKSDVPMLTCNEQGTQLFIIGGQQEISFEDLQALGLREDDMHEHMLLGTIAGVTYRTKKIFEEDGKAKVDFEHPFGKKESKRGHGDDYPDPKGIMPVLLYYPRSKKLVFAGGRYYVAPPESWLNGVSPGIVN